MEAVECGAASLGIILGYFGRSVPLEELRVACGVSRDGSKASNILRAARTYGLEARGFRWEVETLRQATLPVIVFWNFNHFLVVEGFGRGKVYLNDPAEGPRVVSTEEFDASFTGVVLTLVPTPEFARGGDKGSLVAALLDRVRGSKTAVAFVALAGLALVVPGLLLPVFARLFVDKVLVADMDTWFRPLLVGMVLTALVRLALSALQHRYLLRLDAKISIASSSRFLWHVLRLPVEFFSQRYGGEISTRVGLNDQIATFLSARLASTAIDALLVVCYAMLMAAYDLVLTLIGIAAVVAIVVATVFVNRKRVDGNRRLLQEQAKAGATIMGGLSTIETLKASGTESDLFSRWAGYQTKYVNAQQELALVTQLFLVLPPLLVALTNALVLCFGAIRVMQGSLTMGMLVAFQTLMASFLTPVNNLVSLASTLQEMEGNMNRVDDVLRYDVDPQTAATDGEADQSGIAKLKGFVELDDVAFGYARLEGPLIEHFSLRLQPGSRVALVGPSGCGKSTVAKVVTGLYEPWAGEVRFDGRRRKDIPRGCLAGSIAIVDQDIALYEGTIRDNLTLWDSTISEAAVIAACKDACIHDDIVGRQGGYDSRVDEAGANFSGGQRQRLEIARALVGNPRIVVLDEATSALDPVTEQAIDRNLRIRGCTAIIIAHRLSTIRDADEIIVLDQGKVAERGTHEQLMAGGGLYAQLATESQGAA
jgi:NHLM bacteriocin system ABC transporter peptidase/ATP-binding protein